MVNFGLLFRGENFFHNGYLAHFLLMATEFGNDGALATRNLFPEFRELPSENPMIPLGDMHQSFTGVLVMWFFDNIAIFADSFSVLPIHCVARGLKAVK